MKKLSILSPALASIIGAINAAAAGMGTVTIRASKRGMSIAVNGKVMASGKDPELMHRAFRAVQAKAINDLSKDS